MYTASALSLGCVVRDALLADPRWVPVCSWWWNDLRMLVSMFGGNSRTVIIGVGAAAWTGVARLPQPLDTEAASTQRIMKEFTCCVLLNRNRLVALVVRYSLAGQ